MAALSVHQHQGLIGRKPAQRCRTQHVGAVGHRRLREIERRNHLVQDPIYLGEAGFGQRLV